MGAPRLSAWSDKVVQFLPRLFAPARPPQPSGLTPADKEAYARDGFLVFDPQASPELLEQVGRDLAPRWVQAPPGTAGYPNVGRIQDGWTRSNAVHQVALAPRVLAVLWDLYGREPLAFQTLNFPVGTEQPVHSDTIHFNSMPAGYMCGVWVALEDMTEDNGPLIYYPGSHRLPEFTVKDSGVPASAKGMAYAYEVYEKFIAGKIVELGLKPRYATIRKGQAFVWASNLWHGGSPRRDRNQSRHSQVTHFFFSGCKYYTPLLSTEDKIHWRRPKWIR